MLDRIFYLFEFWVIGKSCILVTHISNFCSFQGQVIEDDFKGGAGAASVNNPGLHKTGMIYVDEQSPKAELEVDLSDGENNLKDLIKATPVRHSERTAGKSFKY